MYDSPGPREILSIIASFLRDEVMPQLSGHPAFQLRVSCGALDLVIRQMALEPEGNAREIARMTAILGHPGTLESLNAQFSSAIAEGQVTLDTPGVIDHLWLTTLAKLAVDQPKHALYQREMASTHETNEQTAHVRC